MSATVRSRKTGRVLHQTFTSKPRPGRPATAFCVICGWSQTVDPPGGRGEARALARAHLRWPESWPVFHRGLAHHSTEPSGRTPAAIRVGGALAVASAWAISDGDPAAVRAARLAVNDVVDHGLPVEAALSLAAPINGIDRQHTTERIRHHTPSVALVAGRHDDTGYSIAWIGNCRAYEVRGDRLVRLTTTSTSPWAVRHTRTRGPRGRLVLTTSGLHTAVPHRALTTLALSAAHPVTSAHLMVAAATRAGAVDNVTALVLDPIPVP